MERERVPAAVNQIFPCERVAEQVNRSLLHTAPRVVPCDRLPQAVLRQLCTRLRAKEIIRRLPATVTPILPQNGNHGAAKGNDLRFPVLRVAVEHNAAVQIHVPNLYRPDRCGAAPAVQKKVDNHPVPIFRKGRFANVGLFQKCGQFRVRIGFLYRFLSLVQGDIQTGHPLLIAPREKGFQNARVAVDTVWRKPSVPHGNNHSVQVCLLEGGNVRLRVQVPRHGFPLGRIAFQRLFRKPFCPAGKEKIRKGFVQCGGAIHPDFLHHT